MTKRNSSKNVVIAETIPSVVLDHHSQVSSWSSEDAVLDIEAEVVQELEAVEQVLEAEAVDVSVEPTFEELTACFSDDAVTDMAMETSEEIDVRAAFEARERPDNNSIQKNLKKARNAMVTKAAAKVLLATNVSPSFINRSLHDGKRYNVYAIGKLADIAKALSEGKKVENAINDAIITSLFRLQGSSATFDMELAKACASNKVAVTQEGVRSKLKRHTVSASTAPTQAGSTMQALVTLGVVSAAGTKNPVYSLNDNATTRALKAIMTA